MKNIIDVLNEVTEFIVGKDEGESLLEKKEKTMGFVAEVVKPKRKYTKRKKTNANKK
tara:strand:- start:346 stop:516 length:171 start_codon:yes stop_codon:yes gene_type:complete